MTVEQLLKQNNELLQENNKLLHKLRATQRAHAVGKVVYWLIILAIAFGAYFWVQPYLENIQAAYTDVLNQFNGVQSDIQDISDAKNNLESELNDIIEILP